MNRMTRLLVVLLSSAVCTSAIAQDAKSRWEEHNTLVRAKESISSLGSDLFGDQIGLYSGGLSFAHTDVSIPGNSALPVAVARTYTVTGHRHHLEDLPFGDWDIDLPYVGGVYAISTGWVRGPGGTATNRCSLGGDPVAARPPYVAVAGEGFDWDEYWNGIQLNIPGQGSQEMLVKVAGQDFVAESPLGSWEWVTADFTHARCLTSIQNDVGEGFEAITPDGTKYQFDWMAAIRETDVLKHVCDPEGACWAPKLTRNRYRLYATRVEDRFGNWVTYTYSNAANEPIKLTQISSSDNRTISLSYNTQGHISSVTENGRTWNYQYDYSSGKRTLTSVTRPDSSDWTINFAALTDYHMMALAPPTDIEEWYCGLPRDVAMDEAVGTLTHPSGATGEFKIAARLFGRTNVPEYCTGASWTPTRPDKGDSIYPIRYYSPAVIQKTITGPELAVAHWNYAYGGETGFTGYIGESWATVTGPENTWTRYTYGNGFGENEGLLKKVESGSGSSNVLREEVTEYGDYTYSQSAGYKFLVGGGIAPLDATFPARVLRPRKKHTIEEQDVTFRWEVGSFDHLARPVSVTKASGSPLSDSKSEDIQYHDYTNGWVLGQIKSVEVGGKSVVSRTFDGTTALPLTESRFGATTEVLVWNANGTLQSVADAINPPTTLSNWKRGIPQTITYPDQTSTSAVVNDRGEITSVTDQLGFTHTYQYDSMGRLAQINYPAGDSIAWTPTQFSFEKVGYMEHGVDAGHWRHTVSTGNYQRVTYFDGYWRPVLTREYDATDSGTERATTRKYDANGNETFVSYPSPTPNWAVGIGKSYDSIGRLTGTSADSELGTIQSSIQYLTGFTRRMIDGRGNATDISYQAFDLPTDEYPVKIIAGEGQTTEINRDVFGKPQSIVRNPPGNTSEKRTYGYDGNERLCKRFDPESGTTLFEYDAAGNIIRTASGQPPPPVGSCGTIPSSERTEFAYDQRNRVIGVTYPGTTESTCYSYYADGALMAISTRTPPATECENSTWLYSYNKRRLITNETFNDLGGQYTFESHYDSLGNLFAHVYPSGRTVSYAPNALGQPTQAAPYATDAEYFANGVLKQFTYLNGHIRTVTQNVRGLPTSLTDANASSTAIDWTYAYDQSGNITSIADDDATSPQDQSRTMQYDGLDRLITASAPGLWGLATYQYDTLDNLQGATVGTRHYDYTYDSSTGRLTAISGSGGAPSWTFGYDVRGNQLNRSGTNTQTRTFDAANRIKAISGGSSFRYDGHGRRTHHTRQDGSIQINLYTQDGVLRQQRIDATDTGHSYVYLGGTLILAIDHSLIPGPPQTAPALNVTANNYSGEYLVEWGEVLWATYRLEERKDSGSWSVIYEGPNRSYQRTGRIPGSTYTYQVSACNYFGCGSPSPEASTVIIPPPTQAPNLTAPSQASGQYTINWTSVDLATGYEWERCGGGSCPIYPRSGLETDHNPAAEGNYTHRIRGVNPAGPGPWSNAETTLVSFLPAAPSLSAPATSTAATFLVQWGGVLATQYNLEQSQNGTTWYTVPLDIPDGDSQSVTVSGSGDWYHRVNGCNSYGCSPWSNVTMTTVTLGPTAAPSLTTPSSNTTGSYTVSWGTVTDANTYQLQEKFNSGSWSTIHNATGTSKARSGQSSGTWSYQVRGCNSTACGPYSTVKSTQVTLPPGTPTGLTSPSTNYTGSYTVSWNGVSGATSYTLQEKLNSGSWSTIHNASGTSKARSGRTTGTWYYRVRACNSAGCSSFSGTDATQVTLPPASAPSLTVPSTSGDGNYTVSWGTVSGATGYQLQESYNSSGPWTTIHNGAGNSKAISHAPSQFGATYWYYRVRATNAGGAGPYSAVKSVTIPMATGGGSCGTWGCDDPNATPTDPPPPPPDW